MSNNDLIAQLSAPGFSILDYEIQVTDTAEQVAAKVAFLQSVAALEPIKDKPEPITCMVNCVIAYLTCRDYNPGEPGTTFCNHALSICLAKCGGGAA